MINKLKNRIAAYLHASASWLGERAEKLSDKKKKTTLFTFCAFSCLLSFCVIVRTFTTKNNSSLSITPMQLPPHIGKNNINSKAVISKESFDRIENLKKHLDTVKQRGLLDSIAMFEKIYYSQSKK